MERPYRAEVRITAVNEVIVDANSPEDAEDLVLQLADKVPNFELGMELSRDIEVTNMVPVDFVDANEVVPETVEEDV